MSVFRLRNLKQERPKMGRERNGSFLKFLLKTGQSENGPIAVI